MTERQIEDTKFYLLCGATVAIAVFTVVMVIILFKIL
jgi:hypothetical protein